MADRPSDAMDPSRLTILATVAALARLAAPCAGQDLVEEATAPEAAPSAEPPAAAKPPEPLTFSIASGFQYLFETNIDGGGEISLTRVPLDIHADWTLSRQFTLSTGLRFELDLYDFKGVSPLGADPWSDVYNLTLDVQAMWALDQRTRIFGGPVVGWYRESGADWGSSVVAGGLLGMTYAVSPKLIVGAGMGVVTRIEDDLLIYPIIVLNWRLTERTYLTSRAGPAGIAATGLELVHVFEGGWEIGVGARYEFRRFRLDDTGVVPNGVGEETDFPAWIRLTYRPDESFKLDLYCGLSLFGRLGTDDDQGNEVARVTYDPAPIVALIGRLDF